MVGIEYWNGVHAGERSIITELSFLSEKKIKKRVKEYQTV